MNTYIINTVALNGSHHSTTKHSHKSAYRNFLVVLPDMGYFNESYVLDEISYKSEKNMSDASNGDQEPNSISIDTDFLSEFSIQYGKYVLNRVTLIVTYGIEDPTLFHRGR